MVYIHVTWYVFVYVCVCVCTGTDMYVSIQHYILSIIVRVRWGAGTIHTERVHSAYGFVTATLKTNAAWVGSDRTRQVMRIKDWLWEYGGYCVAGDDSSMVILKCLQNGVAWRLTLKKLSCLLLTRLKNNLGTAPYLLAWLTKCNWGTRTWHKDIYGHDWQIRCKLKKCQSHGQDKWTKTSLLCSSLEKSAGEWQISSSRNAKFE